VGQAVVEGRAWRGVLKGSYRVCLGILRIEVVRIMKLDDDEETPTVLKEWRYHFLQNGTIWKIYSNRYGSNAISTVTVECGR
jgi:hypothetical protein